MWGKCATLTCTQLHIPNPQSWSLNGVYLSRCYKTVESSSSPAAKPLYNSGWMYEDQHMLIDTAHLVRLVHPYMCHAFVFIQKTSLYFIHTTNQSINQSKFNVTCKNATSLNRQMRQELIWYIRESLDRYKRWAFLFWYIYIYMAYVVADVFETKFNLDFRQVSYSISLAASLAL